MIELLRESILPVNLPFTILLGLVALYWVIGLMGVVDLDSDGLELDVDGGGEGADGSDGDGVGEDGGPSVWGSLLHGAMKVVGASDAPLIFVISLFSILLWAFNIGANHYFNPEFAAGRATFLLIPVLIGAFVLTRILVIPMRPLKKMMKDSEKPAVIVGSTGVVRSSTIDSEFGEVEIESSGKDLILRAVVSDGESALNKGDAILVVSPSEKEGVYVVRSL